VVGYQKSDFFGAIGCDYYNQYGLYVKCKCIRIDLECAHDSIST
jgi:hypothetical protein